MSLKMISTSILVLLTLVVSAQKDTYRHVLKVNAASALLTVPQVGFETRLSPRLTYQVDLLGSFWDSFAGIPLRAVMLGNEARYYTRGAFEGFYAAINLSGATYKLKKWNYWDSDIHQKGSSYFAGLSVGYVWQLSGRWNLEAFLGGGTQQAWYKSFDDHTGERVDKEHPDAGWNKSGEIIPYRGGIMIGYRF